MTNRKTRENPRHIGAVEYLNLSHQALEGITDGNGDTKVEQEIQQIEQELKLIEELKALIRVRT
ncbi:MAG: hypothetical protein ACP5KE_06675 [Candidatus Methanodesulfokora sp.]